MTDKPTPPPNGQPMAVGPTSPVKLINASMAGVIQLNIQEAHWLANAASGQAHMIEQTLAQKKVPIQHIRESEAMAHGLKVLAQKADNAFQELAQIANAKAEAAKVAAETGESPQIIEETKHDA